MMSIQENFLKDQKQNIARVQPFLCDFGNGVLFVYGSSPSTGKLCVGELLDRNTRTFNTGYCLKEFRFCGVASKY